MAQRNQMYVRGQRLKDRSPIYPKVCELCDRLFIGRHRNGRFCSDYCRTAKVTCNVYIKPCETCGTLVTFRRPGGRWCSRKCNPSVVEADRFKNRRRRMARVNGEAGRYTVVDIAERDGPICHICTDPIDMALSGNDIAGPTVDHIIPISRGGPDVFDNVALAHRYCNCCRGARDLDEVA